MGKTPHSTRSILVQNNAKMKQSSHKKLELGARQAHRILVVEKDPVLFHFNVGVQIQHGFDVKTAGNGATGWTELPAINYTRAKSI